MAAACAPAGRPRPSPSTQPAQRPASPRPWWQHRPAHRAVPRRWTSLRSARSSERPGQHREPPQPRLAGARPESTCSGAWPALPAACRCRRCWASACASSAGRSRAWARKKGGARKCEGNHDRFRHLQPGWKHGSKMARENAGRGRKRGGALRTAISIPQSAACQLTQISLSPKAHVLTTLACAQRAIATILLRAEVKLVTCAQLFEAGS